MADYMTVQYLSCVICLRTTLSCSTRLQFADAPLYALLGARNVNKGVMKILSACKLSIYIGYFTERARICKYIVVTK